MKKYVVKKGDTMWSISKATGVRLNLLMAANPQITDPNRLQPGQVILIPELEKPAAKPAADALPAAPPAKGLPGTAVPPYFGFVWPHVVQSGETWERIAQRYGVPVAELKRMNPNLGPQLAEGDIVYVPGLNQAGTAGAPASAAAPAGPGGPGGQPVPGGQPGPATVPGAGMPGPAADQGVPGGMAPQPMPPGMPQGFPSAPPAGVPYTEYPGAFAPGAGVPYGAPAGVPYAMQPGPHPATGGLPYAVPSGIPYPMHPGMPYAAAPDAVGLPGPHTHYPYRSMAWGGPMAYPWRPGLRPIHPMHAAGAAWPPQAGFGYLPMSPWPTPLTWYTVLDESSSWESWSSSVPHPRRAEAAGPTEAADEAEEDSGSEAWRDLYRESSFDDLAASGP
ncbi:LysM peptidoglycan-binding domain-containing protein [Alicyclobacillus sp.]|uniref:LysM peptidoglycan-binding domain-containing protein n=1 Tax=Alicyclobacillus sp. TaxID=61169 RepID=UPI0025C22785|nr:LysM peptidoglycan-binding domain-containing protein [Alicyclobacillus sp.]MCL6516498.1 LysM peptidoglycan-binding domain-containing protein [Alicyclobacillus sp.]